MALDILKFTNGDLSMPDSITPKALNVINVQLGSLEYAKDFGSDLEFFLQNEFQFQNESFKAYLVERLTKHQINVAEVTEIFQALNAIYSFKIGDPNKSEGLIL